VRASSPLERYAAGKERQSGVTGARGGVTSLAGPGGRSAGGFFGRMGLVVVGPCAP
jgi:hypothetical protein